MDKNTDWKMWRADAEEQGNLTDGTNLYCDKLMKIPKQHNELLAAVKLLPKNDDTRAFHAALALCSSATCCLCYATKNLNSSLVAVRSGGRHRAPNRDFRQKI